MEKQENLNGLTIDQLEERVEFAAVALDSVSVNQVEQLDQGSCVSDNKCVYSPIETDW